MTQRCIIDKSSVPRWARGVLFRHDEARDRWMIVGPERILVPQGTGVDISHLIDGERDVDAIADKLGDEYDADRELIIEETIAFLQQLADRRYLDL